MISIIAAVASNNAIGKNNDLLWHIPDDLKRFKRLTSGHCLVMGRNTWFSLPVRPLPDRTHIVLTDVPGESFEGSVSVSSISEALSKCPEGKEIFVIGGGMMYRQFLDIADRLYITHVRKDFDADTFFPEIDETIWEEVEREDREADQHNDFSYSYVTYLRRD
ncbi:MAG TPA: dihydrofolate reductase [Bacteroidales bacterium]|nr:dihydrofolate reductase [Bacteroidales bacterium]